MSDVMRKLTIAPPKNEDFCSLLQQLGEQNRLPWHLGMRLVDKQLGRKDQGCGRQPHTLAIHFLNELQMPPSCWACLEGVCLT